MKRKPYLRNILIVLLAIALSIGSAELFLRIGTPTARETKEAEAQNNVLMKMQLERVPADRISHLSFREDLPDVKSPRAPADAYPLIDDMPRADAYDENTKRIVMIGDSFIWGAYSLDRNEIFWDLLEDSLRSQGYNVRVDAVASPGVNAYQELRWLTDTPLAEELQPDLVLFGYVVNDTIPDFLSDFSSYAINQTLSSKTIDAENLIPFAELIHAFCPAIYNTLWTRALLNAIKTGDEEYYYVGGYTPILRGSVLEEYVSSFAQPLNEYAADAPFPVVVMHLPYSPDKGVSKELTKPLPEVYDACQNVDFYDCLDEFCSDFAAAKHKKNYRVNASDGHPGSATNYFYAQYFEKILKEYYPEVLGEKQNTDLRCGKPTVNDWLPYGVSPRLVNNTDQTAEYTLTYPSETDSDAGRYDAHGKAITPYFLTQPVGEHYIRVSFDTPVDLKNVAISAENVENIDLYYACINEKLGYDDHTVRPFGKKSDDGFLWTDDSPDRVTGLCIHADIRDGAESLLTLRVTAGT